MLPVAGLDKKQVRGVFGADFFKIVPFFGLILRQFFSIFWLKLKCMLAYSSEL
jgi:hypothetical protein